MSDINTLKPHPAAAPGNAELFLGFLWLGLIGFGGVLPMARSMLVERRRWLSSEQFTELLGLCQFLPGGNVINLSVAVGMEFRGLRGALCALLGLISAPTAIVVGLGVVYARFQNDPHVQHVFAGLAAAAAGLLLSTGIKMLLPLRGKWPALAIVALALIAIAWLRLPLLPTHAGAGAAEHSSDVAVAVMSGVLMALALIFTELSLLAFGGGMTILPEMQRQVVEVHQWMSAQEFSALFAMAQAAPGPNMMIVPLVGWHVAGWAGLLVSSIAKFGPSSIVTLLVMGAWRRLRIARGAASCRPDWCR
ncbi:chromate transporter, chromate ion transporter (CHR) family [Serratia marcescens]|uniref:Chromate transporter, chromate ion transporter (CHR) family n=1 Tax=Serratia marcescens TaxID=615 RepID=A0A379ZR47_SERMA|nr:chromate transporter, chromate ion transporter (CHR) family [Serratia marcescens]